jgi:D-glycero-D-manno-heptose 1,7-bisphosphate phosphatase
MRRAIFLDRDGVINRAFVREGIPTPPKNLSDVEVIVGVKGAIKLLTESNFVVVVVTNQPDVARGTVTRESVESINSYLGNELGIKYFFTCFHDDGQGCDCRKPKPGLLRNAANELDLDLQNSYMVGDRWRDMAAGQAVGCHCLFIEYKYEEKPPVLPYTRVSSLAEAVDFILENLDDNFS